MAFRDGLKFLGDAHQKVVKKFADGEYTFGEAIAAVKDSGNANEVYKRLNRFRLWVNKEETVGAISSSKQEERKKIQFELTKIRTSLNKLIKQAQKN